MFAICVTCHCPSLFPQRKIDYGIRAYVYAVASNRTDIFKEEYLKEPKQFVSKEELLSLWRADASTGQPTIRLLRSSFNTVPISKVEGFVACRQSPWYRKWWGVTSLIWAAIAVLAALGVIVGGAAFFIFVKVKGVPGTGKHFL